jgi:DeoR family fructose operon transcriptional repressor
MKENESIYNKERQKEILKILKEKKRVTVKELSNRFNISGVTIRNDLNILSQDETVVRTHGGAIYIEEFREGIPPVFSTSTQKSDKNEQYQVLSELINPGDVIFIDANLGTVEIYSILKIHTDITIVTNNLDLAFRLSNSTNIHVIILGGRVQNDKLTIKINSVKQMLSGYNITKAFFSAWGFSLEDGLTDNDPDEIELKKTVAALSRKKIAVLDSEKFNKVSLGTFAETKQLDVIITDTLPEECVEKLKKTEIEILITKKSKSHTIKNKEQNAIYSLYEKYRDYSCSYKPYPRKPGKGKRLGFANGFGKGAFCSAVEKSIIDQGKLAGFELDNIIILDNEYEPEKALKNAKKMLDQKPDIFIEFQTDAKTNNIIATEFRNKQIPLVALEIPIPGSPYIGVDNWQSAIMAGKAAATLITERWKAWSEVDLVLLFQMNEGGEATMLRTEGFAEALEDEFGEMIEEKIIRIDLGTGKHKNIAAVVKKLFLEYEQAEKIVMTSITERVMREVVTELQNINKWNSENFIVVTHGCDPKSIEYIRNGFFSVSIAHFPEKYGEYIVPAACAILQGDSVPPYIFVNSVTVTKENIEEFYPKER